MESRNRWYLQPRLWLEAFVLVNFGFLALDIYLAHSINHFHHEAEYVPLWFSMAAPPVLLLGLLLGERWGFTAVWRDVGHLGAFVLEVAVDHRPDQVIGVQLLRERGVVRLIHSRPEGVEPSDRVGRRLTCRIGRRAESPR